jgi:hypothetical protein
MQNGDRVANPTNRMTYLDIWCQRRRIETVKTVNILVETIELVSHARARSHLLTRSSTCVANRKKVISPIIESWERVGISLRY